MARSNEMRDTGPGGVSAPGRGARRRAGVPPGGLPARAGLAGEAARELWSLMRVLEGRGRRRLIGCIARELAVVARSGSLRAIDDGMTGPCIPVRFQGYDYLLLEPDFALVREIFARNRYLTWHGWRPAPGALVVDLGANSGLFTLLCARAGADVIAVEAQSGFQELIARHLVANDCADRVRIVHGLVGAGTGVFARADRLRGASHYRLPPPRIGMAGLVESLGARRVDLLKIDIEGSEFGLLEGEPDWLRRIRRISMEVHPEHGSPQRIAGILAAHGFRCELVASRRERGAAIARFPGYCFAARPSA